MAKDPIDFQIDLIIQSLKQDNLLKDPNELNLSEKQYLAQLKASIRKGIHRFHMLYKRTPMRLRF